MGYATVSDLTKYGMPATAFGQLTNGQMQAAIDVASGIVDSHLRARYSLPLIAWGDEIIRVCAIIATYDLLSVRGYNPAAGADPNFRTRYEDSIKWLVLVQKQLAHPDVTPQVDQTPEWSQPEMISSSVVNVANGSTCRNRGW